MMDYKTIEYKGSAIRIDRLLKRELNDITQGTIEIALRKKLIRVNNNKIASSFRVKEGDVVQINDKLYEQFNIIKTEKIFSLSAIKLAKKLLSDYLLYDHQEFIAINKPDKLATQGGSKVALSVDDALYYLNSQGNNYKLVHRIDKDTSGILLIAKGYEAATKLTKAFSDKIIKKQYLAIVQGELPSNNGKIDNMVKKLGSKDEVKPAVTYYRSIKKLSSNRVLVEFMPITGRMHQIRNHASSIDCPIVGDKKYGKSETANEHLLLHAHKIELPPELFLKTIEITAPLPNYFYKTINDKNLI